MSGCLLTGASKRERTSTSWSIFCAARDVAISQRVVAIPFHLRRPKLLYSWMPAAHRGHEPTILLVSASAVPSSPAPQGGSSYRPAPGWRPADLGHSFVAENVAGSQAQLWVPP